MTNSDALTTFEQKILGLCSGTVGLAHWLSEKYGLTSEDFSTPVYATVFRALEEIDVRDTDDRTSKWIAAYRKQHPSDTQEGISRGIEKRLVKALKYCGAKIHALSVFGTLWAGIRILESILRRLRPRSSKLDKPTYQASTQSAIRQL